MQAPWRAPDYHAAIVASVAISSDVGTTIWSLSHPNTHEMNPLLGKHPSPARVVVTGLAAMSLVYVVADRLPNKFRPVFLYAVSVVEFGVAIWNVEATK